MRLARTSRSGAAAALVALVAAGVAGCARAAPLLPASAEARVFHYQDNSGLLVGTYTAALRRPLPGGLVVDVRALADFIAVSDRTLIDPTRQTAGDLAPDVVTSASATIRGGEVARKWRHEGQLGLGAAAAVGGAPAELGAVVRVSTEKDYESLAGGVRGAIELFQRNLALSGYLGYGKDEVVPVEPPPGQADEWPATHDRWTFTGSATQLISPSVSLSVGGGVTQQRGRLENPYRRAIVQMTLYPEVVPDRRRRLTGFAAVSWAIGERAALHARQGVYTDDWGVRALIPEAVAALDLRPDTRLALRYRLYAQGGASFHRVVYDAIEPHMSGDPRLGAIREHAGGVEVTRWLAPRWGRLDRMAVRFGYDLSLLEYRATGTRIVAHIFHLGVAVQE